MAETPELGEIGLRDDELQKRVNWYGVKTKQRHADCIWGSNWGTQGTHPLLSY
jgi:hypothetical protein